MATSETQAPAWLLPCPCACHESVFVHGINPDSPKPCPDCQGTGRIEKRGPEAVAALLEALLKVNGSSGIYIQPTIRGTYMVSFTVADKVYESDTLEAALSQALAAAGEVAGG